ncbi:unnamed protein product [Leptidea sinapis]|uniref:Uncharacterized protein n=1 Tax=Leptidea sinapis TaxID=189913 RepID=A0A5E4QUC4_9NEOP|nr:unnamed protein product [Leptidea sinapis]
MTTAYTFLKGQNSFCNSGEPYARFASLLEKEDFEELYPQGQFKDNQIHGKGIIQWKDDTWYEGYFVGSLRHGRGLYVDSRKQRSYTGEWLCGTKHGQGAIYYSGTFKNSYDVSGYKGEWEYYTREGKGLMIWPNHDFYRGGWKNDVMSGFGIYIWEACYNNSMSVPSLIAYNGNWEKGQRHGYGVLNLGFGLGSYYKGEFRKDKKDGAGMIVTNNGLILKDQNLFIDDNFGTLSETNNSNAPSIDNKRNAIQEPFKFDICDQYIGLYYHIDQALKRLDKEREIIDNTISEYLENNKERGGRQSCTVNNSTTVAEINIEEFMTFEEIALRKALQCYEMQLKSIYYQYATICNTEEVHFTPVLIRLYFWQLFYDCNIHSHLTDGCGLFVPLKGAYDLYRIIGEPCTIRDFLCAIRYASHSTEQQPVLVEEDPLLGQNAYVFGDEITYVADHIPNGDTCEKIDLKLFNIGNLSSKTIIKIFSSIFPNIISNENVINLDIELVFFEFFEVFIACVEESIRLKDEEAKYQDELFRKGSLARNTEINLHNMPKVK